MQVNDVIVPVTVTNDKGKFVSDLNKEDFQVFDQGKLQNITYFTRERNQPVVIGFLMDLSNASKIQWKNYQNAATELVLTLLPGDKKYSGYPDWLRHRGRGHGKYDLRSGADHLKLKKIKPTAADRRCTTRFTRPAPTANWSRASRWSRGE